VGFFKHREIDNPQHRPLGGVQVQVGAQLTAQRAQRFGDDFVLVSTEENQVTVFCAYTLKNRSTHGNWQVFYNGRLQAFFEIGLIIDLDVRQTFSAVDADKLGVVIDLLAR